MLRGFYTESDSDSETQHLRRMSTSKKRKLSCEGNENTNGNPVKRQRINDDGISCSRIFTHGQDIIRFNVIYLALKSSDLISKLDVPQEIIQEIAEQGTGNVENCTDCGEKVIHLAQDVDSDYTTNQWYSALNTVDFLTMTPTTVYHCSHCICRGTGICSDPANCPHHSAAEEDLEIVFKRKKIPDILDLEGSSDDDDDLSCDCSKTST